MKLFKKISAILRTFKDVAELSVHNFESITLLEKEVWELKQQLKLVNSVKNQDTQIPVTAQNTSKKERKPKDLKKNSAKKNEKKAPKNTKKK